MAVSLTNTNSTLFERDTEDGRRKSVTHAPTPEALIQDFRGVSHSPESVELIGYLLACDVRETADSIDLSFETKLQASTFSTHAHADIINPKATVGR